ncbi:MAG: inositol monophosphatase, partial [Planctomycetes bacterium]|nr:inositol monophosphatase [Planctomycetota bacterium]
RWTWVVDPLDGTTNYAHGLPAYSVALALVRVPPGRVEVAVVHAPRLGETYSARRGGGTLLNGAPVRVSDTERLGDALLASGFAYERNRTPDDNVANWGRLVMACRDLRRGGSASIDLACVAAGRHDGFWELHLAPWDKAPGSLLVEEAGGQVTDHEGGASWLEGPCIVATNGRVHEALRRELEPLRGPWPLAAPH